mgnify:CR=1 FL=1
MMRKTGVISSQTLLKYEKRMTTSVFRANRALAREIDAALVSQPGVVPRVELVDWKRDLQALIFKYSETVAREGVQHILQATGRKSEALELVMMGIRYRLRNHSARRAQLIEEYLRQRITRNLESGMSVADARTAIRRILNTRGYAERIARTETHTALERGSFEAARSLGVRMTKEWVSREDGGVRPDHAAAHGQVQEIETPFTVGGVSMLYPGDPSAPARQTVNCRCTVTYSFT